MTDSKNASGQLKTVFHKQKRGLITRQELLLSAREIFARDGFENARLEDIASNIGKTRGALYDNFENKEAVFYAIFEQNIERDKTELASLLARASTLEKRIQALIKYLIRVSQDRERVLLNLEFKLYAIRHPRKRQRFADLHDAICLEVFGPELRQLLQQLGRQSSRAKRMGSLAISGVMDGLVLGHLFDPEVLDSREVARHLKLCLSEILQMNLPAKKTT
ncbi:AcrR family transcriptional regulator [Silvibacterium bohemicum]|uniref:AcrR family transcriptional regulator n=1 Tax=Silvibacterium bohemicum TaxID=1577686 RepID=A0A841K9E1_9BACT|nr:TetR/AcrR family transcriptional regulator [Silvibacterium bohemicum]MBB6147168.1 AcrR family transcriptional regulator [Silvibacterium bohemicum]